MAFYSSNFSNSEYHGTPYISSYDVVPFQDSSSYSDFVFNEEKIIDYYPNSNEDAYDSSEIEYSSYSCTNPKLLEYSPCESSPVISYSVNNYPTSYEDAYDPSEIEYSSYSYTNPKVENYPCESPEISYSVYNYPTNYEDAYGPSEIEYTNYNYTNTKMIEYYPCGSKHGISYSVHNSSEPKVIEYDPNLGPYGSDYDFPRTQFRISYSTLEFNETAFEEYDPTPYGGGYDPNLAYGKPLPPSDKICYPRSSPESNGLSSGFSYNSIPSPYGNDDDIKDSLANPIEESKQKEVIEVEKLAKPIEESKQKEASEVDKFNGDSGGNLVEPLVENQGEERENYSYGHDYPWSGYEDDEHGNGRFEGYDYECAKNLVVHTQYGYPSGADGMDFCESIFGYWPCLARRDRKSNEQQEEGEKRSNFDPWEGTAEYIFGSPLGYGVGGRHPD